MPRTGWEVKDVRTSCPLPETAWHRLGRERAGDCFIAVGVAPARRIGARCLESMGSDDPRWWLRLERRNTRGTRQLNRGGFHAEAYSH